MCGFLFSTKDQSKEVFISRMEEIKFRGPDYTGYSIENGLHFGHLRLSILDLDPRSHQPFEFEHLNILFNGEIYNYLDIREDLIKLGYTFNTQSDTEVLIKGYHAFGVNVLSKLNGMFAFLIYDKNKERIFGARDRLGVKPLYYSLHNGEFEVCSQLAPLKATNSYTLNMEAISMYIDCAFIPNPFSIYNEVKKLEAGSYFEYDIKDKTYKTNKYWDLKIVEPFKGNYNDAKEQLKNLLFDAVKIRLHSDVPLGSFLSSGIDSALVSAIASQINPDKLNTFTIGFDDSEKDESGVAEQYSKILNTNQRTINCGPEEILDYLPDLIRVFDEPFGDNSALPTLLLNKKTKEHVTVALSGDGGDESFLGYYHFESLEKFKRLIVLPFWIRKILYKFFTAINAFSPRLRNIVLVKNKEQFIFRIFSRMGEQLKVPLNNWFKNFTPYLNLSSNLVQQAADINIKLWLEGDSNTKVDRGSMAYSVEIRSPFLDYRVVEFARTLPVNFRLKAGNNKRILKDILEEFIPKEIFMLPKRGFSMPMESWIRNELRTEIQSTLCSEFFSQVPNLNRAVVEKLVEDHLKNGKDNSKAIWKIYILAKWMKTNKLY